MDLESTQNNALAKLPLLKQEDGNSFKPVARTTINADGTSTSTILGAVTADEKILKKNDLKAQSILMITLPSEHLITFNQYKDAKTLFKAIKARFGGNEATKKTQKTLLKPIQSAILGENVSQEDLNFKFLRSLPSEWIMHVMVWRNKPDLGLISFDYLYNNFKIVEQEVKRSVTSSSNSNPHNVAFVSTPSSTNDVNTSNVLVNTASSSLSTASTTNNTARLSDATIYAFLANQPNGSQVVHEDLEQIHEDDLEEIDLKCQLALLSMKERKFYQRTGKKIIINGSDTAGYDKTKVECFNCHKMGHFARECKNPRSQENRSRNQGSSRRTVNVEESSSKAMLAIDGVGFDWSFMTKEKTPTNFALMAFSDSELNKSEFDLANYKRGLASVEEQLVFYKKNEGMLCDQIAVLKRDASFNESEINALKIQIERLKKEKESNQIKIDNFENASKSLDKLIGCQISDNNRKGYRVKVKKNVSENSSNDIKKTSGAPVIEDWVSDSDEDETMENVSESANVQKPKQADHPRKSGLVPISAARQSSSRAAASVSTVRPIKTAAPKPFMNVAKSRPNAFQKSHSPSRRPFYQQTTFKNRNLNNKVNIVKANSVNTAKGRRVTNAVGEQGIDAVRSKAFWVWRPKLKVLDHDSKNSGSYIYKQFDYVDPTGIIKEDIEVSMNILSVLVVYHTTNGHQFTMSNRHQELASPEQTVSGKDFSNPFIVDSLLKTIWFINAPCFCNKALAILGQTETVNDGEQQITVIVDGHKFAITEASVRRHLQLADVDDLSSLPNTEIFEQLSQMGFLNAHNAVYVAPSLKQKLFSNMKIGFSGVHVPLFDTMLLHDQPGQGEGLTVSVESQHIPTASSPSKSQPTTSQPTSSQATSSQAPSSHEPTTEPITTTSSPDPQET
ncbi:putative ribonuclease H-like domain-containing protein [Tanacetum coccineum]